MRQIFGRAWMGSPTSAKFPTTVTSSCGTWRGSGYRHSDTEGEIAVLLNVCSHRGFEFCQATKATATSFKCLITAGPFDTCGKLLGAPLDQRVYGMTGTSRNTACDVLGSRCATAYLRYLDTSGRHAGCNGWDRQDGNLDQCGNDKRIPLGPPTRFHVNANWKTFMDTAAGDDYHPVTLPPRRVRDGLISLPGSRVTGHARHDETTSWPPTTRQ